MTSPKHILLLWLLPFSSGCDALTDPGFASLAVIGDDFDGGPDGGSTLLDDEDGDGVLDVNDFCPGQGNMGFGVNPAGCPYEDTDGDGRADYEDQCPEDGDEGFGLEWNGCPIKDSDGDGVPDPDDACPFLKPPEVGPNGCAAPDSDADGISDLWDWCPADGDTGQGVDLFGCPYPVPSANDEDGDGILDGNDACPSQGGDVDWSGCPDSDRDGVNDRDDACPDEGDGGNGVDGFGCPYPPSSAYDTDGDGILDDNDSCPNDGGEPIDANGCPL